MVTVSQKLIFFLDSLIRSLNNLFENGMFIKRSKKIEYPMLILNLFDLPAKAYFLNHIGHTGYFSCTNCYIKGCHCGKVIFPPEDNVELRDYNQYNNILKKKKLPYKGVKGRSPFSNLVYFNFYKSFPIDSMHNGIGGVNKRLFNNMLDPKFDGKPCYLNFEKRSTLHRRLNKFGCTSEFKRFPRNLNKLSFWKTNEYLQFLFYESPIVLKDLLNNECYNHWLLLVYFLSKLWRGNLKMSELVSINDIIVLFVNDIELYYCRKEYTMNVQLLLHLVDCVINFGPSKSLMRFYLNILMVF